MVEHPFEMPEHEAEGPEVRTLSRRQFLLLTGGAFALANASLLVADEAPTTTTQAATPAKLRSFTLPGQPSHNPGFLAREMADGGLVLWANQAGKGFRGYGLNALGRKVWQLCDGKRNSQEIASAYESRTGRAKTEALAFIAKLTAAGIVISGGKIVAANDFPLPYEGHGYHLLLKPQEGKQGS